MEPILFQILSKTNANVTTHEWHL